MKIDFTRTSSSIATNPLWFLMSLVALIALPLIGVILGRTTVLAIPLCYTAVVVTGMYTVASSRTIFRFGTILGLSLVGVVWINYTSGPLPWVTLVQTALLSSFFLLLFYYLIRTVLMKPKVDMFVLYGVVSGYFLLGVLGSLGLSTLDQVAPNSFSAATDSTAGYSHIYLSFVTMTTLGYGDIRPLSEPAMAFLILLAVTGQLYLAIVTAVIVGKFLTDNKRSVDT